MPQDAVDCGGGRHCKSGYTRKTGGGCSQKTEEYEYIIIEPPCGKDGTRSSGNIGSNDFSFEVCDQKKFKKSQDAVKRKTNAEKRRKAKADSRRKSRDQARRRKAKAAARRRKQESARRRAAEEKRKADAKRRAEAKRQAELARQRAIAERKRKTEIKRQKAVRIERQQRSSQADRISAELERQQRMANSRKITAELMRRETSSKNGGTAKKTDTPESYILPGSDYLDALNNPKPQKTYQPKPPVKLEWKRPNNPVPNFGSGQGRLLPPKLPARADNGETGFIPTFSPKDTEPPKDGLIKRMVKKAGSIVGDRTKNLTPPVMPKFRRGINKSEGGWIVRQYKKAGEAMGKEREKMVPKIGK